MKKSMKWILAWVLLSLLLMIVPAMATNSGGTWSSLNSGLVGPVRLPDNNVYAMAIDPTNSKTIYVGMQSHGVYKTTNGGDTWSDVSSGLPNVDVYSLAIDPTNSQIIYAGTTNTYVSGDYYPYGRMFKSANGGGTWSPINNGLPGYSINSLAIDQTNSQIIYAGILYCGVYKSIDGGGTWNPANDGLNIVGVGSVGFIGPLTIDPTDTQTIFAVITGGLVKSTNGGDSWSAANSGLSASVEAMVFDPTNSQIIYAGTSGGMFKSTNGGGTWSAINSGLTWLYSMEIRSLAIDPKNSQIIYAGTPRVYTGNNGNTRIYTGMVFQSTNGGDTWIDSGLSRLSNMSVSSLAVDPTNSQNIYAGTTDDGTMPYGTYNDGTVFKGLFNLYLPTISGTPTTIITAGNGYSFTANATNSTSFSITNKPAWASFNTTPGALTGTPTKSDEGTYSNIVISATNSIGTVSLPAFSITVTTIALPMPAISGTPATSVTAGNTYSFTPTATNASSFSISNKPAWASFNTTTGALTGTPTNSNAGTNSNILISATNSTGTATLSAFTITITAAITVPGAPTSITATPGNSQATVTFSLPADIGGSAITSYTVKSNPAGGTDSNAGTTATSHAITGLTNGIAYTFTCTANNAAGTGPASAISNSVIPSSSNAPVLSISTLSNNSFTNNATLNITGTVTAANILKSLTINDTAVAVNLDGSFSAVVTLRQGANPLAIIAIDNVGKQTSDIRTINYDTTMPAITITAPADNSVTGKTFTDITGSVDDPNATVTAKINGGSSKSATMSGQNFSVSLNLISGLNTIDISATDQAGNSTSVKRTITTDIAVPTLAITNPAQDVITSLGSITISGTVTDAVTSAIISIAVDGQTYTPTVATNGSFSQAITLPTEKTYAVVVTATDQGNNNATVQRNIIKTAALTQPTISDALKVLQAVVGITPLTATEQIRYDVAPLGSSGTPVGNGIIDAADVILILRRSIGIGSW
jgi:hypothetical protein